MTQRFFHTLTHFVVIFTTLFLVFGPIIGNLAYAQLPTDEYEPPTEGYESYFDTTPEIPIGPSGYPSLDAAVKDWYYTPPSEEELEDKKDSDTPDKTESGNSVNVVQAINLANSKNFETIYNFLVMAGGWVASLGGMLFDFAFERLVLEFGCWFVADAVGCSGDTGQVGGAVNQLWTVVRDLFNLVFIFSLVYIGLRLIIDANETATQKTVGLLIAAALLVNFSLYIGKLVIDVSNFTAVQIHEAMVGGFTYAGDGYSVKDEVTTKDGPKTVTLIGSTGKESISGAFMQILYISTFFSSKSLATDGPGALLVGVIAFIFLCYLGFVLAYGAVMVVVRFIALVFLLIFSPAMFLGWVLPQFETYSKQWRTNFISYCFFIPAYVFLLYTSLFVLIQVSEVFRSNADYGAVFSDGATDDTWSIFLLYFLGVGFLYASTKVAGAMAKSGAVVGMNTASKAAALPLAWGYRNTVGRGAGGLIKGLDAIDRRLARAEDSSNKMSKLNPLRYGTKAALSVGREVAGGKTTRGAVENVRNYGVAGNRGRKQTEDDMKEQNERVKKESKKISIAQDLKSSDESVRRSAFEKLSTTEIDEMAKSSTGRKQLEENAHLLRDNHIKKLEDEHPELAINIKNKKKDNLFESFQANPDNFFRDIKPKEAAKLESRIITSPNAAPYLNQKILHHIFADSDITDADRQVIRTNLGFPAVRPNQGYTPGTIPPNMSQATYTKIIQYLNSNEGQLF